MAPEDAAAPWRAPLADEDPDGGTPAQRARGKAGFYVVPLSHLVLLQLLSLGWYSMYWSYKHWDVLRRYHRRRHASPLGRAFFNILYFHPLFRALDRGARERGYSTDFHAGSQAMLAVGMSVVADLIRRAGGTDGRLVSLMLELLLALPLGAAQRVANLASGYRHQSPLRAEPLVLAALLGGVRWWLLLRY